MTAPDINELLDKDRFAEWLRSHNPAANVGETNRTTSCPLAEYLKANGAEMPSVGATWVSLFGETATTGSSAKLPGWARTFVMLTDKLQGNKYGSVSVRAYQARRILERIS